MQLGIAAFESIDSKTRSPGIFSAASMSSLAARFQRPTNHYITESKISAKSSLPVISSSSSQTGTSSHRMLRRHHFSASVQRLREKISFRMLVRIQQAATLTPLPPSSRASHFGDTEDEEERDARYREGLELEKYEDELDYSRLQDKLNGVSDGYVQVTYRTDSSSDEFDYPNEETITIDIHGSGSSGGSEFFSQINQEDTTLIAPNTLSNYAEPPSQASLLLSPSTLSKIQNDNRKYVAYSAGQKLLTPRRELNKSRSWNNLGATPSNATSHWDKPFLERYLEDYTGQAFNDDYLSKPTNPTASSSRYPSNNPSRFHLPQSLPTRKNTKDSTASTSTAGGLYNHLNGAIGIPERNSSIRRSGTLRRGSRSLEHVGTNTSNQTGGGIGEFNYYNRAVEVPFGSEEEEFRERKESWQKRYDECIAFSVESGIGTVQTHGPRGGRVGS